MSNVRIISIFVGVAVAFGIGYGLNAITSERKGR